MLGPPRERAFVLRLVSMARGAQRRHSCAGNPGLNGESPPAAAAAPWLCSAQPECESVSPSPSRQHAVKYTSSTIARHKTRSRLEWSERPGVVELFPGFSAPSWTCTLSRIRLSISRLLLARMRSAQRDSKMFGFSSRRMYSLPCGTRHLN